jgi:hypothetical protein
MSSTVAVTQTCGQSVAGWWRLDGCLQLLRYIAEDAAGRAAAPHVNRSKPSIFGIQSIGPAKTNPPSLGAAKAAGRAKFTDKIKDAAEAT